MSGVAVAARPATTLSAWQRHVAVLALVAAAMLLLFAADAGRMAAIWWGISSYEHCLLIVPIVAWLVWIRRGALAAVPPAAWAPPLAWIAAGALGWLLGEAGGVAFARHLGLVMMLQGAVAALLGPSATRILLFPLGYALFLVPAGDALVPPLQTLTARMAMALLRLTHVRARLDGVFITTPHGWFRIAEACAGGKFLIAMAALGVLVAHLGFSSWRRRLAFLALCLAVPILANGVRASATIWVAQLRGAQAAAGFDHVVYGWIFFAIVITLVMAIAWRFFDRAPGTVPAAKLVAAKSIRLDVAALSCLLIVGAAPAWATLIGGRTAAIAPQTVLPPIPGWTRAGAPADGWRPHFDGADRILVGRYRDARGGEADLAVALYARQGEGREIVGYGHGAADPDGAWTWTAAAPAPEGWRGERIEASGRAPRLAWTRYVVDGRATDGSARAKLLTLRARLAGGDPLAGAIIVSARDDAAGRAAAAGLARALGDPVRLVDRVAGRR